jgi:hypothetical protein
MAELLLGNEVPSQSPGFAQCDGGRTLISVGFVLFGNQWC